MLSKNTCFISHTHKQPHLVLKHEITAEKEPEIDNIEKHPSPQLPVNLLSINYPYLGFLVPRCISLTLGP